MRVAIVENTGVTHHGQVGVALHEAGALVDVYRPFAGQPLPADMTGLDALVVFGGEQTARDDHTHPYLPALARLMQQASDENHAVLGVCLGSQLLARGYGADNIIGATPEFGWVDITLTDQGRTDPVLGALSDGFPIFQWHSDTFTLPPGAVHLAHSKAAHHQAFRLGRATYGTQFHFEANRAVVADWTRRFGDLTEKMEPGWVAAHPQRALTQGVTADAAGLAIARGWVALAADPARG